MMKNEKQLVLFLQKNSTFNQTQLAAKLNQKFIELGDPVLLPPNSKDFTQSLIIFNSDKLSLTMNYQEVSFIFKAEDKDQCLKLIFEIIDVLIDFDFDFVRFGYISTYTGDEKEKKQFKKYMFQENLEIDNDFQIAWYRKELIDSVSVNVWERHLTDLSNHVEFASIFDINTPIEEEYNINSDFLETFLKKCEAFISKKMNLYR